MRNAFLLITLALTSIAAKAQISTISENRYQTTKGWVYQVRNLDDTQIEAFYSNFKCPQLSYERYFDPLVEYAAYETLKNGGIFEISLSDKIKDCSGGVSGVLYSDGSYDGDTDAIKNIYARRKGAYNALVFIDGALTKKEIGSSMDSLIAKLSDQRSVIEKPNVAKAEWSGGSLVLTFLISCLKNQRLPGVPQEGVKPLPSPTTLSKTQGLSPSAAYDQAVLVRLRQWEADLNREGFDYTIAKKRATPLK
jgi:hypothetical protein